MTLTESQILAVSLAQCISGSLSTIGSALILYLIITEWRASSKRSNSNSTTARTSSRDLHHLHHQHHRYNPTYYRILAGLSFFDVIFSFSIALSTLPVPKDTPFAAWAIGNRATCTTQGFGSVIGYAGSYYNSSLAIFFLLRIRNGIHHHHHHHHHSTNNNRQNHPSFQKVEPLLHIVPILTAVIPAIILLHYDSFHFAGNKCWIASYPHQCADGGPTAPCERGMNRLFLTRWIVAGGPLLISFLLVFVCMIVIVRTVRTTEQRMRDRYDFAAGANLRMMLMHTTPKHQHRTSRDEDSGAIIISDNSGLNDEEDGAINDHNIKTNQPGTDKAGEDEKEEDGVTSPVPPAPAAGSSSVLPSTHDPVPPQQRMPWNSRLLQSTRSMMFNLSNCSIDTDSHRVRQPQPSDELHVLDNMIEQKRRQRLAQQSKLARTQLVRQQALMYISAYLFGYIWSFINRNTEFITGRSFFPLQMMALICTPLQGFFNFFIFYWKYRKDHCMPNHQRQQQRRRQQQQRNNNPHDTAMTRHPPAQNNHKTQHQDLLPDEDSHELTQHPLGPSVFRVAGVRVSSSDSSAPSSSNKKEEDTTKVPGCTFGGFQNIDPEHVTSETNIAIDEDDEDQDEEDQDEDEEEGGEVIS